MALQDGHRLCVLKQGGEAVQGHFPPVASLTPYPDNLVPKAFFLRWLEAERPAVVFFNEYNQRQ
jgi:hypothetical protein